MLSQMATGDPRMQKNCGIIQRAVRRQQERKAEGARPVHAASGPGGDGREDSEGGAAHAWAEDGWA